MQHQASQSLKISMEDETPVEVEVEVEEEALGEPVYAEMTAGLTGNSTLR